MIALEPGQQWLSQFRLLKELVPRSDKRPNIWLAEKHGSSAKVVLKFLRPGAPSPLLVRRLADWRATRIPQFMPLLGVHTVGEQMALELPFVPDDNAALRGTPYTKWSVWLEQLVETVQALHRENFVHGDIKLTNVRRDANGRPLLSDPWLPGDGKSPYTASPERLNGAPASVQDDIYALGALLHELATGYPPRYPGADPGNPAKPRHEMPPEALELMHALLRAEPAQRPPLSDVLARLVPMNMTSPQAEPRMPTTTAIPAAAPSAPKPAPAAAARTPQVQGDDDAPRTVILGGPPPVKLRAAPRAVPPPPRPVNASPHAAPAAAPAKATPPAPAAASASTAASAPPMHDPTIIIRSPPPLHLHASAETPFEPVPLTVGPPTWMRPAGTGVNSPSPFQSRASVWRWPVLLLLLGAAIAAFVWLPEETRQSAVQQVTDMAQRSGLMPAQPSPPPPAPSDLKGMGEQKLAAEQLRDQAVALENSLRGHGAAARTIAAFVAGGEALKRGLAAFERRDFTAAHADFTDALRSLQATQAALPQLHRRALADGDAALAQCLSAQALNEYRYALALSPDDAAAKEGIARAEACDQVYAHISAGAKAEQGGDTPTAVREYQAALQLDPKSAAARSALAALTGQVDETQFSRLLAAALESLRTQRYSAAATAIAAADRMRPNNADVQRLNQQLSEVHATERLQALKTEAAGDEREEHWGEALDAYRAMLAVDGTLVLALQGAQRSQDRMQLDAELAGYIDNPDRLSGDEVRSAAQAALARARVLPVRGPRIETQISRVGVLLSQYDAPVQVALRSDGLTDVTIYRVGALGKFSQRAVSLKPGKYTFVGSRLGYRDVRREVNVAPGDKDASVEIRCEEQI